MKTIYWEIGEELRNYLEENNFDISKAIEIGSNNNSTIFNTTDSDGVIISLDYISYNGELYNGRVSDKVKVYEGGPLFVFPNIDVYCRSTKLNDTKIPISDDNYFVMHNVPSREAYRILASKRMVVFFDYGLVKEKDHIIEGDSIENFAYREYSKFVKLVKKNKKIYFISVMIPHERVRINKTGRTK